MYCPEAIPMGDRHYHQKRGDKHYHLECMAERKKNTRLAKFKRKLGNTLMGKVMLWVGNYGKQ